MFREQTDARIVKNCEVEPTPTPTETPLEEYPEHSLLRFAPKRKNTLILKTTLLIYTTRLEIAL